MQLRNRSKRRWGSRMMTAMLAMILCMATSLSALAGDEGRYGEEQTAEFTKTLQYAKGLGLEAPTVDFTFTVTAVSKDNDATVKGSMPEIPTVTLNFYSSDSGDVSGSMYQISKTSGNVLSGLLWTALGAGAYEYQVTETATTPTPALGTGEAINSSQAVYRLYVFVEWDSANAAYVVTRTYSERTTNDNGETDGVEAGIGKGGANPLDNNYNFKFINTYIKEGGSPSGTEALTITNTTTGTGSDVNKQFTYTIIADDSVTGKAAGSYTGTITRSGGGKSTIDLTADSKTSSTFTLANGDKIIFDDLPVGTTFTVKETGESGYLPTYSGTTAKGTINSSTSPAPAAGESLSTDFLTIGAINNVVNYTNTYDSSIIPTGVLSAILPFAALIAAAMVAFVIFAAINRRKVNR
ncbi:MAG: DUF7601 domain-containing protein [Lachnospiraceae bacterium]